MKDELLKVNDHWVVMGIDTTDFAHYVNTLYEDHQYLFASTDNTNEFVMMSLFGLCLLNQFRLSLFTHRDGHVTIVLYDINNSGLADNFILVMKEKLNLVTVIDESNIHSFKPAVSIDRNLVTKLLGCIKKL